MKIKPMHFFLFLNVLFFGCVPQTEDLTVSNEFQEEFVRQVNRYRTEGCHCGTTYMPPVEPISWNDKLAEAAENHANDMHRNRRFSHTGSNGSSLADRIEATGYNWRAIAENISHGYPGISAAVKGWVRSEGHCKNMMNGAYSEMGGARAGDYWVQTFGSSF
jgi:uncharacterized protein YkwD